MTISRVALALGLSLALAVPTATFAASDSMDSMWQKMKDHTGMMMTMPAMNMPAMTMPAMHTAAADMMATWDADFWLKCSFHKTAACDEAMATMMAAK